MAFTPRIFIATSPCVSETDCGHSADQVLVHELTHAARLIAGTVGHLSLIKEEILAILVANIYSSETNRLRAYDP